MNGLQDKKILESVNSLDKRQIVEGKKRKKYNEDVDGFVYSSLNLDQLIVFEVDLLQDILESYKQSEEAKAGLRRIRDYAIRNSENARDLRRRMVTASMQP